MPSSTMGEMLKEDDEIDLTEVLHDIPAATGQPEHILSPRCWCSPELTRNDLETGVQHYLHRWVH